MAVKICMLFYFINALAFTAAEEPSCPVCSRYEYEEKLLERVLRNELALENTLKEIKETNAKVLSGLAELNEHRVTLMSALDKAKHDVQTIVQDYRREINISDISQDQSHRTPIVYFRARTPATTFTSGNGVVFSQVEVNEGQGYNKVTGKFAAPVTGVYIFSVQYCAAANKWAFLGIVQDDALLEASGHHSSSMAEGCVTLQVFTALSRGQNVWVKDTSPTDTKLYEQPGHRHTSFSGVLIHS
ncbi:hypothetical protein DPMN_143321 [Dreissena polymorpha]|uniref:C1q domain-containing protein n=1 Tax=Dreissena polymorpha TaxID=45954 RepID=A0A9D4GDG1_DREPO|nr:hypothetical protein DPMN_143321 [Dreissena polymorpha]